LINAITGVPGEGKTCFSVQHIILKELMHGNRPIFSNVAWHNDEVIKFCDSYGYEVDPKRLFTLEEDQISSFWEYTPHNCLIVLDEVAEFFNSQAWKDIGPKAGAYARQHRKLGHETYLIVQDLGHIYKQFRDMVFEEIRIVNLSNRSFGPFKLPKFFLAKWIVKDSGNVQQTKLYRFNTEVFKTYSTLATVGGLLTTGEEVSVKQTKKRITLKDKKQKIYDFLGKHWMPLSIIAFICSIIYIPKLLFWDTLTNDEQTNTENITQTIIEKDDSKTNSNGGLVSNARLSLTGERTESPKSYLIGRYDTTGTRSIRYEGSF
jgi:hypothetical protein